jgi:hypothetical protein
MPAKAFFLGQYGIGSRTGFVTITHRKGMCTGGTNGICVCYPIGVDNIYIYILGFVENCANSSKKKKSRRNRERR